MLLNLPPPSPPFSAQKHTSPSRLQKVPITYPLLVPFFPAYFPFPPTPLLALTYPASGLVLREVGFLFLFWVRFCSWSCVCSAVCPPFPPLGVGAGCVRVCLHNPEKYTAVDELTLRQDPPPPLLYHCDTLSTNTNHTHIIFYRLLR